MKMSRKILASIALALFGMASVSFAQTSETKFVAPFSKNVVKKQKELNKALAKKFPSRRTLQEDGVDGPMTKAAEQALASESAQP